MNPLWVFDLIGYFGSIFVILIVFLRLFSLKKFFHSIIFLLGAFLNYGIDLYFKSLFKDPRPTGPIELKIPCWSWLFDGCTTNDNSLYRGIIQYGFPSGHAQSVLYGTSFLFFFEWLERKSFDIYLWLCLLVCGLTLIQRFKYRRHTIQQLIAGTLLGSVVGWSVYNVAVKTLKMV
jgi:membrane-associated phospholipid phosphatase